MVSLLVYVINEFPFWGVVYIFGNRLASHNLCFTFFFFFFGCLMQGLWKASLSG
jgi:hypothetical protein